jgi:hypothetical protein
MKIFPAKQSLCSRKKGHKSKHAWLSIVAERAEMINHWSRGSLRLFHPY